MAYFLIFRDEVSQLQDLISLQVQCSITIDAELVLQRRHYLVLAKIYNIMSSDQYNVLNFFSLVKKIFGLSTTFVSEMFSYNTSNQYKDLIMIQRILSSDSVKEKKSTVLSMLISSKILEHVVINQLFYNSI